MDCRAMLIPMRIICNWLGLERAERGQLILGKHGPGTLINPLVDSLLTLAASGPTPSPDSMACRFAVSCEAPDEPKPPVALTACFASFMNASNCSVC